MMAESPLFFKQLHSAQLDLLMGKNHETRNKSDEWICHPEQAGY